MAVMKLPDTVDREFLYQVLLARESLGSTGIGDGIAIPHVRNPVVLHVSTPTVTLCFLEHPIDFHAIDDQPVNTLFTLISPTVRTHLHLLSRLGFILRTPEVKAALRQQVPPDQLLGVIVTAESTIQG
ncbi:MAG: PTS sugar transporter subunit IIA [bacterium]